LDSSLPPWRILVSTVRSSESTSTLTGEFSFTSLLLSGRQRTKTWMLHSLLPARLPAAAELGAV
jgi:hypothetical protein